MTLWSLLTMPPSLSSFACCLLSYFPFFPLLRPCNLSLLFYLPEGECFWITGLINKVNPDGPPLTQHGADREAAGDRGTAFYTPRLWLIPDGSRQSREEEHGEIFWGSSKTEILERTVTDVRRLLDLSSKGHVVHCCCWHLCSNSLHFTTGQELAK